MAENKEMTEEEIKQLEEQREEEDKKTKTEEKQTIDRIIRGVNDVFEKRYDFDDLDIHFTIKLRAPNAIEIGRIQGMTSSYLGGMNNYASQYMLLSYQTLASLRVVGIDVPKELENDEDIYNLDMLYIIGRDFQQWLGNFRL